MILQGGYRTIYIGFFRELNIVAEEFDIVAAAIAVMNARQGVLPKE